jgi:superfamily II DNA/RNA helicase
MKISYAITVCNELEEIKRLLPFLIENKREEDEIVVFFDSVNGTDEVEKYLRSIEPGLIYNPIENYKFRWYGYDFDGHFSNMKNELTEFCIGDYIFNIDADEMITEEFINTIPTIIENNPEVEFYWVPRENYVTGLTLEHIQQWGWRVDVQNRVNYPDYQGRIYKNDSDRIKWQNKVHEVLTGYKQYATLPEVPALSIIHTKTIEKQEKQNNYYNTL